MPYSRATTAPCDIAPPISITKPAAVRKRGVQPGSVEGATRISPGSSFAPVGSRMTRADPVTVPGDAGDPSNVPSDTPSAASLDDDAAVGSVLSESNTRGIGRRRNSQS